MAIDRLMSHMAGLTYTLPCQIARSTFISLVFNEPPDEQCLLTDLLLFVTDAEHRILKLALSDYDQVTEKKHVGALTDFFEHNELHEMPKKAEIRQQLATVATNILVTKPEPFIELLRNGLPALHVDTTVCPIITA